MECVVGATSAVRVGCWMYALLSHSLVTMWRK